MLSNGNLKKKMHVSNSQRYLKRQMTAFMASTYYNACSALHVTEAITIRCHRRYSCSVSVASVTLSHIPALQ